MLIRWPIPYQGVGAAAQVAIPTVTHAAAGSGPGCLCSHTGMRRAHYGHDFVRWLYGGHGDRVSW